MLNRIKALLAGLTVVFLASCATNLDHKIRNFTPAQRAQLDRFITSVTNHLDEIWGSEELIFKPQDLVKYSDNYQTRGIINFSEGKLVFETTNESYAQALRKEIIMTVLMANSPDDGRLYEDNYARDLGKNTPFLINQLRDQTGKPIRTIEEANAFADFLIMNKISVRRLEANGSFVFTATWPLIKNHLKARAETYRPLIYKYAGIYNIDPRLMFAIMEVESAFNPYARSYAGAIGLMQIVPSTAGTDVFRRLGRKGKPTEKYLYDPQNNIEASAIYFNIMKTSYFSEIKNPLSLRYMLITSYNAGPGGTLSIFHKDRSKAIDIINRLSPAEVYRWITHKHYSEQARNYLYKVTKAYPKY